MTYRAATTAPPRGFTLIEMLVAIGVIVVLAALTVSASVALVRKSEVDRTRNVLTQLDIAVKEWEMRADRKLTWGVDPDDPPQGNSPYEITDGTPHVFTATDVLRVIGRVAEVKAMLGKIRPEFVYEYYHDPLGSGSKPPPWLSAYTDMDDPDPWINPGGENPLDLYHSGAANNELAIIDPWGEPIRAVHPGRISNQLVHGDDPALADDDGTIMVGTPTVGTSTQGQNEAIYGIAESRQVFFVSAGPDGKWGNLYLEKTAAQMLSLSDDEKRLFEQAADNIYSYEISQKRPQP